MASFTIKELQSLSNKIIMNIPRSTQEWPETELLKIPATPKQLEGYKQGSSFSVIGAHQAYEVKTKSLIVGSEPTVEKQTISLHAKKDKDSSSKRILHAKITLENYCFIMAEINNANLSSAFQSYAQTSRLFKAGLPRCTSAQAISEILIKYCEIYSAKLLLLKPVGKAKLKKETTLQKT